MKKYLYATSFMSLALLSSNSFSHALPLFSGLYGGGQIGYGQLILTEHARITNDHSEVGISLINKGESALAGLRLGYDWMIHSHILGVFGEGSIAHFNSSKATNQQPTASSLEWLWSVRARYGYQAGKTGLFLSAGFAFSNLRHQMILVGGADNYQFNQPGSRTGGAFGIGIEHSVTDSSRVGVEFTRYHFGNKTHYIPGDPNNPHKMSDDINTVQFTYTYKLPVDF